MFIKNFDQSQFLKEYWQKKPLLIRQAFPDFQSPVSGEELAGLALEEEIESRLIIQKPGDETPWHLHNGPLDPKLFTQLPPTHWTFLVQGVDRLIPEVQHILSAFDFIPGWRLDDIMISYAAKHGGVGPHFDHYDVFLFQAEGRREWRLTSKQCHESNYKTGLPLRIMNEFEVEETFILEAGDMLYVPPFIGHDGIAQSDDCMTWSVGYRSYRDVELLESFADFCDEHRQPINLYQDPDWSVLKGKNEIPVTAIEKARSCLTQLLNDEQRLNAWFGQYVSQLDRHAEALLPEPYQEEIDFTQLINDYACFTKDSICRFAYFEQDRAINLFINGQLWQTEGCSSELLKLMANTEKFSAEQLKPFLNNRADAKFLGEIYQLQWLVGE